MMQFLEILYAEPLLKFLVDTTMKSFVIFAVAGLFAYYLRRKSAAVRGLIWSMAIVGCLIVPLFSLILPKWEINVLPEMPIRSENLRLTDNARPAITPILAGPNQSLSERTAPSQVTPTRPQPTTSRSSFLFRMHWTDWIAVVWVGMSVFFFARLIVGISAVWRISARGNDLSRASELVQSNWNRPVSVRLSNRITVPMMWGFLRPVILLPVDADHWQTERLRAVLLHELAHIKRADWVMLMVGQITCALYWFNPLVWFAVHRMRIEAEQACDDQVLNAGYQSTDYAQLLLDMTHNVKIANATSRAAVAIARSSKIEGRLRTVLAENLNRHPVRKVTVGIGLLILTCFAVPMGAMRLAQAVNPEDALYQQTQKVSNSEATLSEDRSDAPANTEQVDENVEICKQHLLEIGKAIQVYQQENGDFPEWLSELHPEYLPDVNLLLCPADSVGGKALFPPNIDPKMPVSYGYGFHPGYRKRTTENRAMYGDVLPLVRCRHHVNQPFGCLNLSFSFKVYPSSQVWEYIPEEMYGTSEKAIAALETGLQQQPNNERLSYYVYPALVRLYIEVGRKKDAKNLINRFKSNMKPDDLKAHFDFSAMLEIANRDEEALAVFEKLEKQYPSNRRVLNKLARIHEELGNSEIAEEYRKKADPTSELVGKIVHDFSATDLDGKPISLQQYRGKVVLLDFWAVWHGPCIAETPNVKRVYDTYKGQGFDVIGVSLDTDETRLRNYLKKNNIPWRQIFSGQKWKSPVAQQYHIHEIPAPWLIARDGTLISREARGLKLERLVVKALRDKIKNE